MGNSWSGVGMGILNHDLNGKAGQAVGMPAARDAALLQVGISRPLAGEGDASLQRPRRRIAQQVVGTRQGKDVPTAITGRAMAGILP